MALMRDHTVLPATTCLIHRWYESYLPLFFSREAAPLLSILQWWVKKWYGLSLGS